MAAEQVAREARYLYNEPVDFMTFMTGGIIHEMANIILEYGEHIEVNMEVFFKLGASIDFEIYNENDYIEVLNSLLKYFDDLNEFKFRFCIILL